MDEEKNIECQGKFMFVLFLVGLLTFISICLVCGVCESSDAELHYYVEEHIVKDINFNIDDSRIRFITAYDITLETGEVVISNDISYLNVGSKYKMMLHAYCDDDMLDDDGNLAVRRIDEVIYVRND